MNRYYDFIVNSESISEAPEIMKLLPLGHIKSQKGNFDVTEQSFKDMYKRFKARGLDLVIDYEHQTLKDEQAPAAGWIKELILEPGKYIAAKVEWTEKAKQYISNKEYRYSSPVVMVDKKTNCVIALHSVALTNTPAIDEMYTIVNSLNFNINEEEKNMEKFMETLCAALGLTEGATEEQVLEAIEKMSEPAPEIVANKIITDLLEVDENATTAEVTSAIMALKNPTGNAEYIALKERLDKRDAEDSVNAAMEAGKITPATREWAISYALKDPAGFRSFVANAPQVVPTGKVSSDEPEEKDSIDETTTMVCKMMGISEDDIKKYGNMEV